MGIRRGNLYFGIAFEILHSHGSHGPFVDELPMKKHVWLTEDIPKWPNLKEDSEALTILHIYTEQMDCGNQAYGFKNHLGVKYGVSANKTSSLFGWVFSFAIL